jgi:hypothetical protein
MGLAKALCGRGTLALLLLTVVGSVPADTLYRWVDSAGVTHFSDSPPPEDATAVRSAPRPELPPPQAGTDYYSIVNQSRRLEASRIELEQARQSLDAARAEQRRALAEADKAAAEARLAGAQAERGPVGDYSSGGAYLAPYQYYGRGSFRSHRPLPDVGSGETVVTRSIVRPHYELQYGQRRFAGFERITVQEGVAARRR